MCARPRLDLCLEQSFQSISYVHSYIQRVTSVPHFFSGPNLAALALRTASLASGDFRACIFSPRGSYAMPSLFAQVFSTYDRVLPCKLKITRRVRAENLCRQHAWTRSERRSLVKGLMI